jgi:uncharacterized membrane protein SirB2
MSLYTLIRIVHTSCALLSICGFAARGYLKVHQDNVPQSFKYKVLPHIVDTVLLASAIMLVILSGHYPFVSPWVTAKLVTLLVYISGGILLMRLRLGKIMRGVAYVFTMMCGAYIILVAFSKSPAPW